MTTKLYMEAIAEAKQLKNLAEQNAKNKIIEALTPKIQSLVEAQLLSEQEVGFEELVPEEELEMVVTDDIDPVLAAVELAGDELVDDEEEEIEANVVVQADGDVNINISEISKRSGKNLRVSKKLAHAPLSENNLAELINLLRRKVRRMDSLLEGHDVQSLAKKQRAVIQKSFKKMLAQAVYLQESIIVNPSNKKNNRLRASLLETIKEIKIMKDKRSSTIFSRLFEADDGDLNEMQFALSEQDIEDLDVEEEVDADEEFEQDVPVDKDAAESALEDLGAALGLEIDISQEEEEVDIEVEEEEVEDIDLEEYAMFEADDDDLEEAYEIDEAVLRRELRRMKCLKEADVPADIVDQFGGGDDEGELYLDVDEDDLINALADELGDPGVPTPKVENRRRVRRSGRRNARRTARPSRRLQNENKALSVKLQKANSQLNEMNLFNAKLLYVNKLMQNKNLSTKQQRAIVEALDNAKTIREAKLLYQGLAKSVKRKSLTEGASRRPIGSASKSTRRSGTKLNESKSGAVADRWAILAGINKNK